MPERTCLGCRGKAEKSELLRVVARDGALILDADQREPGRGAYLHRGRLGCVAAVIKRRALPRALRAPQLTPDAVEAGLAPLLGARAV